MFRIPYIVLLIALLIVKAAIMIGVILYSGIGLGPDEAQYWTWSKTLDWGYYSKPPGIAWQIGFGTLFFGDTELGVRFGSVCIAFLIPLAIYFTAKASRLLPETGFWAAVMLAFSPFGISASLFAITDVGMIFFWTLALGVLVKGPNYFLLGLLILCGALFKWPIYSLWLFVPALIWVSPLARNRNVLWGFLISLLGLIPSVIWNASHDWVTFRHVSATVGNQSESSGNVLEFVGAQFALMSPILFVLLFIALLYAIKNLEALSVPLWLLAAACFVPLFLGINLSFFKKMQGNWCDFAYPSGFIFLAWYLCEKVAWGKVWLTVGVALSVGISALVLSIPYLQGQGMAFKWNPFKHNIGWNQLAPLLTTGGYRPGQDFLFGDKYQTASILSFYGPKQTRAYFFNLQGMRKNQFSFWPSPVNGSNGYFVAFEPMDYSQLLSPYFSHVDFILEAPLTPQKKIFIYKGLEYNGQLPENPEKY